MGSPPPHSSSFNSSTKQYHQQERNDMSLEKYQSTSSDEQPHLPSSSDEFNPNRDSTVSSGFITAPSSPPATPPQTTFPAVTSPQAASSRLISSPTSTPPEATKPSGLRPTILHGRDAQPSHHLLKVDSFSAFSKPSIEKYSSEFEAGDYKWNLSIYPSGDKTKDGEGHISMYLEMLDTTSLLAGWEVNTICNFFVFDQLRDKYVGPQDGTVRRFHCMKTQWGIVKFIDLKTFKNPSNGYLINDTCSFGVEVFVLKCRSKAECLSIISSPLTPNRSWKFRNVSKKTSDCYGTEYFVGGDYKWRVLFYPNGYQPEGNKINNIVSVYLHLDTSTLAVGTKLFVHYTFRIMDQKKNNHFERSDSKLFWSAARGFRNLMSRTKLQDPENGFLVGDTCIVGIELQVLGLVTTE